MQKMVPGLSQILGKIGIDTLNEMQLAAWAAISAESQVILLSPTGSGKTLAYLLPILSVLDASVKQTQAVIVVPTRELALQIESVFKSLGTAFKITCCYGGHKRETEENNLREAPTLIVGTPGRLGDHIRRGNIQPSIIKTLVLDEFDKQMELGFQQELEFIVSSLPALEKKVLVSATDTLDIPAFLGMTDYKRLDFLQSPQLSMMEFRFLRTGEADKMDDLFRLLCMLEARSSIIFLNHRDAVERCSRLLSENGIVNVFYHGAMEQQERETALCKFRNGSANILVTTDLASRGLDIENIRYIIHYHLPPNAEAFIHRNGRTARMDASGTVILLLSPVEELPAFVTDPVAQITLPELTMVPDKPKWVTLFFGAGKKDKLNKVDIVGFLSQKGALKQEDIGLIEVKDYYAFVAVRKSRLSKTLPIIQREKIKNKKIKIDIAR